MRWSEAISRPSDRRLREFATILTLMCVGLAVWHGLWNQKLGLAGILVCIAAAAAIVAAAKPRWLAPVFVGWMVLAFPIAWTISTLVLMLIYFGLITPLALCFRLIGRDPLDRKLSPEKDTYWSVKPPATTLKQYLRQF